MIQYKVYVDGSYNRDTNVCGIGLVILKDTVIMKRVSTNTTDPRFTGMFNVGGEVISAIWGLSEVHKDVLKSGVSDFSVELLYDYAGIEKWATKEWKANKFGTKWYQTQARQLIGSLNGVVFTKVKAHSGNQYNDMVDMLAKRGAGI